MILDILLSDFVLWTLALIFTALAIFSTFKQYILPGSIEARNLIATWTIPIVIWSIIFIKGLLYYVRNNFETILIIIGVAFVFIYLSTPPKKRGKK
ncbi:MAG: hypothetical protein R3250_10365 [Melioribacteraceae bacterium]|nr:hypothetical protein [Melioribacteraceae bacterium]